ncbi:hypothetical protein ZIOFF_059580 [Zingiber officinale]|uniref:Uncharacterized protein n=1 Tax=Zingiber officinale TaxID=94328 RepID=A0A8J5KGW1_ZINOF|nr:hypothetical protein ZIOFF_059580 [Zingiber officinale]
MQKELLIKLIKCLEQTSIISGGNHTEVSDYNTGDSQSRLYLRPRCEVFSLDTDVLGCPKHL